MKGLRKYLTPFAPDQSGAVSVLYELGGILVICDAGGCVGNICGFDEPRWTQHASAIFSAGLRDMDAIMGRDEKLIEKLASAAGKVSASFAAVIGTPVPAVIATDYHALKRMTERKVKLPILTLDTNGMELYDRGAEKAYEELVRTFAVERYPVEKGRIGVFGVNPLDQSDLYAGDKMCRILQEKGWKQVNCYGMGAGLEEVRCASAAEKNLVTAPSGLKAAKYLEKKFGTPYEIGYPMCDVWLQEWRNQGVTFAGKKVLILHQQVIACSLRREIETLGAKAVQTATWFMKKQELSGEGDMHLTEEDQLEELMRTGGYDIMIGDSTMWEIGGEMKEKENLQFLHLPHFAVSGEIRS